MKTEHNIIYFADISTNSPTYNMAADYVLSRMPLEHPVFRVYRWEPYSISLGQSQKLEDINLDAVKDAGLGLVRRETGGRAVFHAEELTYSMIIPKHSSLYADSIFAVYNTISEVLVKALRASGVNNAELSEGQYPNFKEEYKEKISAVCFSSTSTYEVTVEGKKIIGSAQKRQRDTVLQHGSILVGRKHLELLDYLTIRPELRERFLLQIEKKTACVADYLSVNYESYYKDLSLCLQNALCEELHCQLLPFDLQSLHNDICAAEEHFVL